MLSVAAMFEANLMESTCLGRSGMAVTAAAEPRSGTRACRKVSPRWRRQTRPRAGYRRSPHCDRKKKIKLFGFNENLVALTGIEPRNGQIGPGWLVLSSCVFSPAQIGEPAQKAL